VGFYSDRILPHLIRSTMRDERFTPYRRRNVALASGRVLEVGIGSGENLSQYGATVTEVIGIEPSARLAALAKDAAAPVSVPVTITEASAERLPLDAESIDTVVMTWTLCSIPHANLALAEMRRVLKPSGRLLFVEHGLAPDRGVRFLQRRLTRLWKHLAGGCHLDRDMRALISEAGFRIERIETGYMSGARPMSYIYEGCARVP
jgi:ubiquinone/menaquinone biosynthesis C-methylase UbiE